MVFQTNKGVILFTPFRAEHPKPFSFSRRLFIEKNIENFKRALVHINWNHVIKPEQNVNENYISLLDILQMLLNKYIPIKKMKTKIKLKNLISQ